MTLGHRKLAIIWTGLGVRIAASMPAVREAFGWLILEIPGMAETIDLYIR